MPMTLGSFSSSDTHLGKQLCADLESAELLCAVRAHRQTVEGSIPQQDQTFPDFPSTRPSFVSWSAAEVTDAEGMASLWLF